MAPSGPAGPSRGTLQTPRVAAAAASPLGRCHGWGGAGFPSAGLNGLLRPEPRAPSPGWCLPRPKAGRLLLPPTQARLDGGFLQISSW